LLRGIASPGLRLRSGTGCKTEHQSSGTGGTTKIRAEQESRARERLLRPDFLLYTHTQTQTEKVWGWS